MEQELWQREEKGLIGILPVRDAAETAAAAVVPMLSQGDLLTYSLFWFLWATSLFPLPLYVQACACVLMAWEIIIIIIFCVVGIYRRGKWFRREKLKSSSWYIWFSKAWCQKSTGKYSMASQVCFIAASIEFRAGNFWLTFLLLDVWTN